MKKLITDINDLVGKTITQVFPIEYDDSLCLVFDDNTFCSVEYGEESLTYLSESVDDDILNIIGASEYNKLILKND